MYCKALTSVGEADVYVHLARAQIQGRDWLLVDSNFSQDKVRVRLLNLVGPIHKLVEFAIGQGKRTSVHLFGALTRGLADLYDSKKASFAAFGV